MHKENETDLRLKTVESLKTFCTVCTTFQKALIEAAKRIENFQEAVENLETENERLWKENERLASDDHPGE